MSAMDRAVADAAHGQAMAEQARPRPAHSQLGQHGLALRVTCVAHSALDSCPVSPVLLRCGMTRAPAHTSHSADSYERRFLDDGMGHAVPSPQVKGLRNSCRRGAEVIVVAQRPENRL